jgi:hypothetical protein
MQFRVPWQSNARNHHDTPSLATHGGRACRRRLYVSLPIRGASAQTVIGLADGKTLLLLDSMSGKVTKIVPVSGAASLIGFDVRPADGMLYGVTADGTVVTVDPMTGKAMEKSKLKTMLPNGVTATVDFNPVADRLRIIGSDGTNLRANVDDGSVTTDSALKFAETDMHRGEKPDVIAGAYINSTKGPRKPRSTISTARSAPCSSRRRRTMES